ncbi:hypothetical protein [Membranihabitans maritimus]|uniref:hypothetical protein n=1 Tax=Membranihabitans maritimus TaxID=2904244 RepID=UPI001F3E7977|nr:hypothetical protein [Membranihabitans maritimus]
MKKKFICNRVTQNPSNRITVPKLSRIFHSSPSGIYALLILMISMFLFSCEDREPVVEEPDKTVLTDGKSLSEMTNSELKEYFESLDLSDRKPNYTRTWTDTLSPEEFARFQNKISVRSGYDCGINIKLNIDGTSSTTDVTVYEAGTITEVASETNMEDGDDFDVTINGDTDYDIVIEDYPNTYFGSLEVDPDWGGKTVIPLDYQAPTTYDDYNFECPAPTDGTCDAYVSVYKHSGDANEYRLVVVPDSGIPDVVDGLTGNPAQEKDFHIDESRTYDFYIYSPEGGMSETFDVKIIRADGIAHGYNFFGEDMSDETDIPVTTGFDYFECP